MKLHGALSSFNMEKVWTHADEAHGYNGQWMLSMELPN